MIKKHFYVFILIFLIIFFVGFYMSNVTVDYFENIDGIKISPNEFTDGINDMSYRLLDENDSTFNTFTTNISKEKFSDSQKEYRLVIYQLNGEGYKVYINDICIGSAGDFIEGKSNIWNSINFFTIDANLIKDNNEIRIISHNFYDVGLTSLPILIVDNNTAANLENWYKTIINGINAIGIGVLILGFIIMILLYFLGNLQRKYYLYISLSMILGAIFFIDYTSIYQLPIHYLLYKKIVILSLYGCMLFASLSLFSFFNNYKYKNLIYIVTFLGLISTFISHDMITFKRMYNYYIFVMILIVISWIIICVENLRKSNDAKIFFVGIITLFFTFIDIILKTLNNSYTIFKTTSIYFILIFVITIIILLLKEFMDKIDTINNEIEMNSYYEKSRTDSLTKLFNFDYISNIIKKISPPFTLVLIDVDNFKEINSKYGLVIGDLILKVMAKILKENVRDTDIIGRYQGDTFVVILKKCPEKNAVEIMSRIQEKIIKNKDLTQRDIFLSTSVGIYNVKEKSSNETIFRKVIKALYIAKTSKEIKTFVLKEQDDEIINKNI